MTNFLCCLQQLPSPDHHLSSPDHHVSEYCLKAPENLQQHLAENATLPGPI